MNLYQDNIWNNIGRSPGGLAFTEELITQGNITTGRILEIGCGDGSSANFLINRGFQVYAIDTAEELINKAKKANPSGFFHVASATEVFTFFSHSFFDAVLMECTALIVGDIWKDCYERLKPNGILMLSDLYDTSLDNFDSIMENGFKLKYFSDKKQALNDYAMKLVWNDIEFSTIMPKSLKGVRKSNISYYTAVFTKEIF